MFGFRKINASIIPQKPLQPMCKQTKGLVNLPKIKQNLVDEFRRTGNMKIMKVLEDFEQMEAICKK